MLYSPTTTEWKCGGISRAKPLMTNADQASVRLSGRTNCHDFQHLGHYPKSLGYPSEQLAIEESVIKRSDTNRL